MIGLFLATDTQVTSPNVDKLVIHSATKKAIDESELLNTDPLLGNDLPIALKYIKDHPDCNSYYLLIALKRYHPQLYIMLADEVKAKVLCSTLRQVEHLNDWGYLDVAESYDGESACALL